MPGLPPTSVGGVTELWFEDVESIAAVFTAESYLEVVRPDEAKFLDLEHVEFLISGEHPVFPRQSNSG
jgi:EthD domain